MRPSYVDLDGYRLNAQGLDCARGRSGTPQGPQRATGGAERAGRSPRPGGPEEYKRSTRSPRPSAGMRPAQQKPADTRVNTEYGKTAQQEGEDTSHG